MNAPTTSSRASGSSTFPTTPKSANPRHHGRRTPNVAAANHGAQGLRQRKAQSSSPQQQTTSLFPSFASSTMCSSPSAKNVPLPPTDWLNKLQVPTTDDFMSSSRPSSSNSESSSSTSSLLLSSPISGNKSSNYLLNDVDSGRLRVCPLQLIAAVASA